MRCTDEDTVKLSHVVQLVSLAKEIHARALQRATCKRTLYCFSFSDIKVTRVWGVRRSQRSAPEVVLVSRVDRGWLSTSGLSGLELSVHERDATAIGRRPRHSHAHASRVTAAQPAPAQHFPSRSLH